MNDELEELKERVRILEEYVFRVKDCPECDGKGYTLLYGNEMACDKCAGKKNIPV